MRGRGDDVATDCGAHQAGAEHTAVPVGDGGQQAGRAERLPCLGVEPAVELHLAGTIMAAALAQHLRGQACQRVLRFVQFEIHRAATCDDGTDAGRKSGSVSSSSTAVYATSAGMPMATSAGLTSTRLVNSRAP